MGRGVGKVRHLDVRYLWVQQKINDKQMHITKVKGLMNPANILTKYATAKEVVSNGRAVGVHMNGSSRRTSA